MLFALIATALIFAEMYYTGLHDVTRYTPSGKSLSHYDYR